MDTCQKLGVNWMVPTPVDGLSKTFEISREPASDSLHISTASPHKCGLQ